MCVCVCVCGGGGGGGGGGHGPLAPLSSTYDTKFCLVGVGGAPVIYIYIFPDDYPDFTLQNVLAELADVTNWRDLGLQLGLSPAKLDAIGTESDPKVKMITAWMDQNPGATGASWQKLMRALASPAVCENRVAKGIAEKHGSSFDKESALKHQSLGGSSASGIGIK